MKELESKLRKLKVWTKFKANKPNGHLLLIGSFTWSESNEGHDFWSDINRKKVQI